MSAWVLLWRAMVRGKGGLTAMKKETSRELQNRSS
jgi:hypothetical protein